MIAILRNLISRAYANWRMEQLKGRDQALAVVLGRGGAPLPGGLAAAAPGAFVPEPRPVQRADPAGVALLPREQLLLLRQEELMEQPATTLARVCPSRRGSGSI